jgi:hypothetical protein
MKTITAISSTGKELVFRANVSILDDTFMGFSLYNECDEHWESASMRALGNEHYALNVVAAGLVFPKHSSKAITEALKHIIEQLEKYNADGAL